MLLLQYNRMVLQARGNVFFNIKCVACFLKRRRFRFQVYETFSFPDVNLSRSRQRHSWHCNDFTTLTRILTNSQIRKGNPGKWDLGKGVNLWELFVNV